MALEGENATHRLIVRDAVSILGVVAATGVLFAITLLLFRSFTAHRAQLAQRWGERGRRALAANQSAEAILDLRAALSYAPGTRNYEFLLATALAQTGHDLESTNYFLGLWEARPGDGSVNLALARLAAKRGEQEEALNHYRAAIYGTWEGDGLERRAAVHLELARYLIDRHDLENARMELLMTGESTADSYDRDMTLGKLFELARDAVDAETYYMKAVAARPDSAPALEATGRLAYQRYSYAAAERLLRRAGQQLSAQHSPGAASDNQIAHDAHRLLELRPLPSLAPGERAARVETIRNVAKERFYACKKATNGLLSPVMEELGERWMRRDTMANLTSLTRHPTLQDQILSLSYDTEARLQAACGPATGDDALILRLAADPASKTGATQ